MKCINSIQHHLSWQTVIHRQQHNQISHHQIPLKHQHPVFWVGLIDLPITNWGIYCSQGVHMMQSHESLNLDNNLTLHVQYVAIPRDNGRARVAVNMWTNILLKGCVLTTVAQHNHIPCFGYALVLAINRLFTDFKYLGIIIAQNNTFGRALDHLCQQSKKSTSCIRFAHSQTPHPFSWPHYEIVRYINQTNINLRLWNMGSWKLWCNRKTISKLC